MDTSAPVRRVLSLLAAGQSADEAEAYAAVQALITGSVDPALTSALLTGWRFRGESVDELTGAVRALADSAVRPTINRRGLIDTCGTGGSPVPTFNVSTAAAIVVSAAGVPVAKHGNRSFSSPSGSADVLIALGVNIDAPPDTVCRCLDEIGLAFFFAPRWHPAMKNVAPVRQMLGFRTIFNLIGPLANPAPIDFQLVGVGNPDDMPRLADTLRRLGRRRAAVVVGEDGVDEVTLSAPTHVLELTGDLISPHRWEPSDFDLRMIDAQELAINDPEESAEMIRAVLAGTEGPATDITLANAAAALWIAGQAETLADGVARARAVIESGEAEAQLDRLVLQTNLGSTGPTHP